MGHLLLGYAIIAIGLGIMLAFARETRIFTGLYGGLLLWTVLVGGQLLGMPRPEKLNVLMNEEIIIRHAEFFEGEAIVATVIQMDGSVVLLSFPWVEEQARQLDEALRQAREKGEGVEVTLAPFIDHEGSDNEGGFQLKFPPPPINKPPSNSTLLPLERYR